MKVVEAPKIQFRCTWCKALNEGNTNEFTEQPTIPPSFKAQCGFCYMTNTCFPSALISRTVGLRYL